MSIAYSLKAGRSKYSDASILSLVGGGSPTPTISGPLAADLTVSGLSAATFTRSTTATFTDYEGVLRTAEINEPRFEGGRRISEGVWSTVKPDGSPIFPAPKLLMEGQGQNVCLQSQAFGTSPWTQTNITTNADSIAAPDGTTTADTQTATADNATRVQTFTLTSATYTLSVYLKRKTGTGAISLSLDGGSTYTVVAVTSAWQRFSITQTLANPSVVIKIAANGDAVYAWGAQVEASPVPTSYIPTTTAAVTRTADACSWPLSTELQAMLSIDKAWTTSLEDETGLTWGADKNQSSFADGQAWFDHPDKDLSSYANSNKMMILRDSAGRLAWGFIGAAGTGQTLGSEKSRSDLLTCTNVGYFVKYGNNTIGLDGSSVKVSYVDNTAGAYSNLITAYGLLTAITAKKRYQCVITAKVSAGGSVNVRLRDMPTSTYNAENVFTNTDFESKTFMFALSDSYPMFYNLATLGAGESIWYSGVSVKEVLTPSVNGVFIYKDKERTLQGWTTEASFNMNDTSYTFDIVADCNAEATVVLALSSSLFPLTNHGFLSVGAAYTDGLYTSSLSQLKGYDGSTANVLTTAMLSGVDYLIGLRWSSASRTYEVFFLKSSALSKNSQTFDGKFEITTVLSLHLSNTVPAKYSGLKFFTRWLTDAELMRL